MDKLKAKQLTDFRATAPPPAASPTDGASDAAWTVWTKYDAVPGDGKEQFIETYRRLTADHRDIVAKRSIGRTYGGRAIVGLQVTKGATGRNIRRRPAVLYNALQHGREWLSGETCRRTLGYFVANYGKGTRAGIEVTKLVNTTELWFVCVSSPDGYEFTFTPGNRLWRKNLADNDGDGRIAAGDGVDPNRNFRSNWGRDNEGSSPDPSSETYRGPGPASEPETKAMERFFSAIHPVFQKNDHTAGALLLYPQTVQRDTLTADHEIFKALAGHRDKSAIEGFLSGTLAGGVINNGDLTDWAYNAAGALSFLPEGTRAEDPNVSAWEYPDSELQVEQEFRRHLPFILDLARSARDPASPISHLGNRARDFVVDTFQDSYGDPQPVAAVVKRELGRVRMHFRINGGRLRSSQTVAYRGGDRYYKEPGVFYHRVRGFVKGTSPGDRVRVWFSAGGRRSKSFTYRADLESKNPVLILSNEDYSGVQPNPAPEPGPRYLDYYTAALDAAGVAYDVYDVDAHGRRPPDPLGILAHYSHVVWYTGDDYVPREPDAPGGSGITKGAVDTQNAVRDFINDGGKLFYTGKNAGRVFAEGYLYNPFQVEDQTYCQDDNPICVFAQDDFLQYWLGAYTYVGGLGQDADGTIFPVAGTVSPFDSLAFDFNGSDSAANGDHAATLLVTSSVLDPAEHPLFGDSQAAGEWVRPFAPPFAPHAGEWFLSAGTTDGAYKRLLKPFHIPAGGAKLKFWTSFDLEPAYDYMFVEIHTAGQDDWTTLADENGHTSTDPGGSCPSVGPVSNWQTIHPFLTHYQTKSADGTTCEPTGTSGNWNAATANSGGWQEWSLPIPAQYLDNDVEISVSVAGDPVVTGLGVWVDELRLEESSGAAVDSADPSFEIGMDGWTLPGPPPPPGEGKSRATGWERVQNPGFTETPITTTTDTVFTGFGFEGVTGAANRTALMVAALSHLGQPQKPVFRLR